MEQLPIEIKREIVRFIPRHDTAQIIYDSRNSISLNYVRRYNYENYPLYEERIWDELKPEKLNTLFYGDQEMIVRSNVSKGQHIKLRAQNIRLRAQLNS